MADYTFKGKSLHVDIHLIDGTVFNETFTYTDSNDNPINLTGYTAEFEVTNFDSGASVLTGDENDIVTLGGTAGTVQVQLSNPQIEALLNPCYKWGVRLNGEFRFLRGYIYRNQLL